MLAHFIGLLTCKFTMVCFRLDGLLNEQLISNADNTCGDLRGLAVRCLAFRNHPDFWEGTKRSRLD
jgi:hypothetical protein